jgi:hypothetical protein
MTTQIGDDQRSNNRTYTAKMSIHSRILHHYVMNLNIRAAAHNQHFYHKILNTILQVKFGAGVSCPPRSAAVEAIHKTIRKLACCDKSKVGPVALYSSLVWDVLLLFRIRQ